MTRVREEEGGPEGAPATLAVAMTRWYLSDQKRVLTLAMRIDDAYGRRDVVAPLPAVTGRGGVERIIGLGLGGGERAVFVGSSRRLQEAGCALQVRRSTISPDWNGALMGPDRLTARIPPGGGAVATEAPSGIEGRFE